MIFTLCVGYIKGKIELHLQQSCWLMERRKNGAVVCNNAFPWNKKNTDSFWVHGMETWCICTVPWTSTQTSNTDLCKKWRNWKLFQYANEEVEIEYLDQCFTNVPRWHRSIERSLHQQSLWHLLLNKWMQFELTILSKLKTYWLLIFNTRKNEVYDWKDQWAGQQLLFDVILYIILPILTKELLTQNILDSWLHKKKREKILCYEK